MKFLSLLTIAFSSTLSYTCRAQEYSYTHYDVAEGLAGSTVYTMTQDQQGFLWFGTESGVSRFDGTQFKNFTTADGLPDIEILKIFSDPRGRVWMAPYGKSVCYYYQGKIHNQENDSVLRRIVLKGNIENFSEGKEGNLLMQERTRLHLLLADDRLRQYDSILGRPIRVSISSGTSASGHFWVQAEDRMFEMTDTGFSFQFPFPMHDYIGNYIGLSPHYAYWQETPYLTTLRSFTTGRSLHFPYNRNSSTQITLSFLDDSLIYSNESLGVNEYNIHTGKRRNFLKGIEVSRTFRDMSGNLWFTTLGQGIFRLNSDEFRTIRLNDERGKSTSIYAILKIGDSLLVGNNMNCTYYLSLPDYRLMAKLQIVREAKNRILYYQAVDSGRILVTSDNGLGKISRDFKILYQYRMPLGTKAVFPESNGHLLVGSYYAATVLDPVSFKILDTVWRERSTAVYAVSDTMYIGTLNGLYRLPPDKVPFYMGKLNPILRNRISYITGSSDHILWVATYDGGGIVGIRGDSVFKTITSKDGLTSDICRTLLVHDNILWVGTDKGLNKVELGKPGYPITRYTSNDGLASDVINSIYADGSTIYIGTPAGLSYFDEGRATVGEDCRLYLLAVINKGQNRIGDTSHLFLRYKENGIRMEFAGISYRSSGNITYRYRLEGLDTSWQETKDNYLEYPTLPSGNYTFQVQAVNRFGISSRLLSLPFTVETPFWRTIWFTSLVALFLVALTWLFVSWRIRGIRRRQAEKEELNQRMADLEHKALQAQMNPHFIFNCLNSIQQFIFSQDILVANKYIAGLAKLIRATLQHSSQTFITLGAEIDFLETYLSLEKLRFKDKMNYSIETGPGVDTASLVIPPMLIQPYVENSMRHGLRHKKDGNGYINILIVYEGDRLKIIIDDNGIGREQAARYKTAEHIEYQSKGMSLTADRIRIMNTAYEKDIQIEITDLEQSNGAIAGTRVVLFFHPFDVDQEN